MSLLLELSRLQRTEAGTPADGTVVDSIRTVGVEMLGAAPLVGGVVVPPPAPPPLGGGVGVGAGVGLGVGFGVGFGVGAGVEPPPEPPEVSELLP